MLDQDLGHLRRGRRTQLSGRGLIVSLCSARGVVLWLGYPQPPDRSQHGCTVSIDRGPLLCDAPSRQDDGDIRGPARAGVVKCCRGRE